MKIITAMLLIAMVVYLFPRAKTMLIDSPKGSNSQWLHFVGIIAIIALFIVFLISIV